MENEEWRMENFNLRKSVARTLCMFFLTQIFADLSRLKFTLFIL
jgi:hypothetical protein